MTTETRFTELLSQIPRGSFYENIGNVIPFRSGTTTLRLQTNVPNTNFLILINDVQSGITTTDLNGEALFDIHLPLGDLVVELQQEFSINKIKAYITTREFGVWYGSYAEQLEKIDDHIDTTLNSYYLAKAGTTDIDLAHGVRLLTPNEFGADLDAYREILQFMRQAFRQFGGRLSGKRAVVAAITQVNPLIYFRNATAPRWILGFQELLNGDFQQANRPLDGSDLIAQINVIGNFVTLVKGDSYVNTGTGILVYQRNFGRFKWTPPDITDFVPQLAASRFFESPIITTDGSYTIPSGRALAFLDTKYPSAVPIEDFTLDLDGRLYLNIDNRGDFEVVLNPGFGSFDGDDADNVAAAINRYLHTSNYYEAARRVLTQPAGLLVNHVEVVAVSDNTVLGGVTNPPVTQDIADLETDVAGTAMAYASPLDILGPFTTLNLGGITRLVSNNGQDYVDVLVSRTALPSSTADTFVIAQRYVSVVDKIPPDGKLRITSKNFHPIDGASSIEIQDGPWSQARNLLGFDQKFANLSDPAIAGATQVRVPNGTMELFNSINGVINLPFDVLIGRGPGPVLPEGNRSVTTASLFNPLALIHSIVGLTLNKGFTHIKWNPTEFGNDAPTSINGGLHPIINVDLINNECQIRYNGGGVSRRAFDLTTKVGGVRCIAIDPTVPYGTVGANTGATLDFLAPSSLRWKRTPDGILGPSVNISGGGYFRLYNSTALSIAKWLDVLVDPASLPGISENGKLHVGRGFLSVSPANGSGFQFWSAGEKATVISVTPDGSDEIWDLKDPLIGDYNTVLYGPYEVLPFIRQPAVKLNGEDTFGNLDINIDVSEEPVVVTSQANINVGVPELPEGWIDRSLIAPEYVITPEAKFEKGALLINNLTNEVIFERSIPINEDICGYEFAFKVWVRNVVLLRTHIVELNLEFDFGAGPIVSPNFTFGTDETVQYPKMLEFSQILPPDATEFKVRIRRTTGGSGAGRVIVEKAIVLREPFDSLFLGDGTTPRSSGRAAFGSLFYVWSPDELQSTELSVLGVGAPAPDGLIRDSHNAHEQIDAFDVTDVHPISGDVLNVRGAVTESDWLASILVNFSVVPRNPTRFSFIQPVTPSLIVDEELTTISQIPPHTVNLFFLSDQNQDNTILYENGIPVPNDQWQFNTNLEIEVISGFVPGALYTIDYNRLTQVETPPIDLESPPNNGNDTWFADFVVWNRHLNDISTVRESISIFFDAAFNATLTRRSDRNKLQTILTEESGTTRRVIPQSAWRYVDSLTINIDGNQFNPNALYSLTYNQRFTDPSRVVGVVAEIRSADTAFSLSVATYVPVDINKCVDGSKRFHQMRLTFTNIVDIRDLRVHSAVVKGLNLSGPGSPPPGF